MAIFIYLFANREPPMNGESKSSSEIKTSEAIKFLVSMSLTVSTAVGPSYQVKHLVSLC